MNLMLLFLLPNLKLSRQQLSPQLLEFTVKVFQQFCGDMLRGSSPAIVHSDKKLKIILSSPCVPTR